MFTDFHELDAIYEETQFEGNSSTNAMLIAMLFVVIWMWLNTA